jgi:hypothetical protein
MLSNGFILIGMVCTQDALDGLLYFGHLDVDVEFCV